MEEEKDMGEEKDGGVDLPPSGAGHFRGAKSNDIST